MLPGSPPGSKGEYALVILDCDGRVLINKKVSAKKLMRFLWEYRPRILAVDNIAELGENRKELIKILNLIPPETEVVQVTRINGEFVDLKELAKEMGINITSSKLDPDETAYILAVLALNGTGTKVKVFEEKTKIVVTKGRTPRAGGSSMSRFVRATKNAVLETVNEIKERLEREGLDYDLIIKKSDGAIDSASFTVYAPRRKLEGIIKPIKTDAVRVRIRPIITRKIMFEDEISEKKFLVVGIDPGIKTGIAILDLNGNALHLSSSQNVDRGDLVSLISKFGIPLIVATDTNPPTHMAKKLASTLKAELYYPKSSLSVKEKEKIALEYSKKGVSVEDSHQRDALAAAHKALMSIKSKLEKVDSCLDKLGLDVDAERIRIGVLRGHSLAELVEEEIEKLMMEEEKEQEKQSTEASPRALEKSSLQNTLRVAYLEAENVQLKMKLKELNEELEKLRLELSIIKKGIAEEVDRRTNTIKESLRQLAERLKEAERAKESLQEMLRKAGEDALEVEKGEKFVALYVPIIRHTTEFPLEEVMALRTRAIYADEIESLNNHFIEMLKETNTMLFVKKLNKKTKDKLEEEGIAAVVTEASVYGDYAIINKSLEKIWKEEKRKVEMKRTLSLDELERLILEYRSSRWG